MRTVLLACVVTLAGCSADDAPVPQAAAVEAGPTWGDVAQLLCPPICDRRDECGLFEPNCFADCLTGTCSQVDCASPYPWGWDVAYEEESLREQMFCDKALAIRF